MDFLIDPTNTRNFDIFNPKVDYYRVLVRYQNINNTNTTQTNRCQIHSRMQKKKKLKEEKNNRMLNMIMMNYLPVSCSRRKGVCVIALTFRRELIFYINNTFRVDSFYDSQWCRIIFKAHSMTRNKFIKKKKKKQTFDDNI